MSQHVLCSLHNACLELYPFQCRLFCCQMYLGELTARQSTQHHVQIVGGSQHPHAARNSPVTKHKVPGNVKAMVVMHGRAAKASMVVNCNRNPQNPASCQPLHGRPGCCTAPCTGNGLELARAPNLTHCPDPSGPAKPPASAPLPGPAPLCSSALRRCSRAMRAARRTNAAYRSSTHVRDAACRQIFRVRLPFVALRREVRRTAVASWLPHAVLKGNKSHKSSFHQPALAVLEPHSMV